jgi:hypothetical protein
VHKPIHIRTNFSASPGRERFFRMDSQARYSPKAGNRPWLPVAASAGGNSRPAGKICLFVMGITSRWRAAA